MNGDGIMPDLRRLHSVISQCISFRPKVKGKGTLGAGTGFALGRSESSFAGSVATGPTSDGTVGSTNSLLTAVKKKEGKAKEEKVQGQHEARCTSVRSLQSTQQCWWYPFCNRGQGARHPPT